ncbi:MAG: ATP-binding protein [Chloroflexota bacterium]
MPAARRRPILLVVSGLPGSGKSTVASAVVGRWPAVLLSVDPIESAMAEAGLPAGFERGLAAYLVARRVGEEALRAGLDVVIDAVSSVEPARSMWRDLAAATDADLRVVMCAVDDVVLRERLARRDRGLAAGEPSWADVEARRAEWTPWPEPHLALDTAAPVAACVEAVLGSLAGR